MSDEGRACVDGGCPEHGMKNMSRKMINGLWHNVCFAQNCEYKEVVWRERRQNQPIQFDDRRKNDQ